VRKLCGLSSAALLARSSCEDVSRASCLNLPSFSRLGGIDTNTQVQEALVPRDSVRQEARRACSERLWLQKLKRWVEGDLELMCSRAAYIEKMSPVASALVDRGILHLPWVSFLEKEKRRKSCLCVTGFLRVSLSPLVFVSAGFVLGRHRCDAIADGFVSGVGDGECCGAGVCSGGCRGSRP
jgi:hypothetical protein